MYYITSSVITLRAAKAILAAFSNAFVNKHMLAYEFHFGSLSFVSTLCITYTLLFIVCQLFYLSFWNLFLDRAEKVSSKQSNVHVAYTTDLRVQSAKYNVHKDSYYRLAKCKSVAAQSIITGAQILEAFKANWIVWVPYRILVLYYSPLWVIYAFNA
jgi:hypothetical protein